MACPAVSRCPATSTGVSCATHPIRIVAVLALAVGTLVSPAAAAPPQYMGLDQLRSVLASSPGGIEGYFLTVPGGPSLGQQDPVQVKMTVKAVADGQGPDGALIFFEADMTDPVMKGHRRHRGRYERIAIVHRCRRRQDDRCPELRRHLHPEWSGAGDPIEYMLNTQVEWPAVNSMLRLDAPVQTAAGGCRSFGSPPVTSRRRPQTPSA